MLRGEELEGDDVKVFEEIWKLRIPPKFAVFAWRLLKERLSSKENLRRRHVEIIDASCPFCRNSNENEAHLFFLCDKILPLWWESMSWVSIQGTFPLNPTQHFSQHVNCLAKGIRDTRWRCWWLALTWAVWQQRNNIIFSNWTFDGNKVMEDAIFTLWTWLKGFEKDFDIPYCHWSSNMSLAFVY